MDADVERLVREERLVAAAELAASRGDHATASTLYERACAFASAAREALAAATVVAFVPTTRFAIDLDYADSGPIHGVLAAFSAGHESADYGARVTLVVRVPSEREAAFSTAVRDATGGRASAQPIPLS